MVRVPHSPAPADLLERPIHEGNALLSEACGANSQTPFPHYLPSLGGNRNGGKLGVCGVPGLAVGVRVFMG